MHGRTSPWRSRAVLAAVALYWVVETSGDASVHTRQAWHPSLVGAPNGHVALPHASAGDSRSLTIGFLEESASVTISPTAAVSKSLTPTPSPSPSPSVTPQPSLNEWQTATPSYSHSPSVAARAPPDIFPSPSALPANETLAELSKYWQVLFDMRLCGLSEEIVMQETVFSALVASVRSAFGTGEAIDPAWLVITITNVTTRWTTSSGQCSSNEADSPTSRRLEAAQNTSVTPQNASAVVSFAVRVASSAAASSLQTLLAACPLNMSADSLMALALAADVPFSTLIWFVDALSISSRQMFDSQPEEGRGGGGASNQLSAGAVAAIVVGVLALCCCCVAAPVLVFWKGSHLARHQHLRPLVVCCVRIGANMCCYKRSGHVRSRSGMAKALETGQQMKQLSFTDLRTASVPNTMRSVGPVSAIPVPVPAPVVHAPQTSRRATDTPTLYSASIITPSNKHIGGEVTTAFGPLPGRAGMKGQLALGEAPFTIHVPASPPLANASTQSIQSKAVSAGYPQAVGASGSRAPSPARYHSPRAGTGGITGGFTTGAVSARITGAPGGVGTVSGASQARSGGGGWKQAYWYLHHAPLQAVPVESKFSGAGSTTALPTPRTANVVRATALPVQSRRFIPPNMAGAPLPPSYGSDRMTSGQASGATSHLHAWHSTASEGRMQHRRASWPPRQTLSYWDFATHTSGLATRASVSQRNLQLGASSNTLRSTVVREFSGSGGGPQGRHTGAASTASGRRTHNDFDTHRAVSPPASHWESRGPAGPGNASLHDGLAASTSARSLAAAAPFSWDRDIGCSAGTAGAHRYASRASPRRRGRSADRARGNVPPMW